MKTEATKASIEFKREGITVLIRPTIKDGVERFVLDYRVKGARKLVWRSTLADARQAAADAINKIIAGQSEVLELTNADAHVYLRARDTVAAINAPLDRVAHDHVEAVTLLAGRATVLEACRDWLKRNATTLPKITVPAAVELLKESARTDRKSGDRKKQLANVLDPFAAQINCEVHTLTPGIVSAYLTALPLAERSKRNHRDVLGFFSRWLVLRGYLAKGTDLLEGVQNYSARITGEVEIYTPDEIALMLANAPDDFVPFIAIGAFAGLRSSEIERLDWAQIDFDEGTQLAKRAPIIEVKPKTGTKAAGRRRLVPMHPNLVAWLTPHRKQTGEVSPYANTTKQLNATARNSGVPLKANALRHSAISYRTAETGDLPRVAYESGNSVRIIETNYLKVVKPAAAARWFSITPADDKAKVVQMTKAA